MCTINTKKNNFNIKTLLVILKATHCVYQTLEAKLKIKFKDIFNTHHNSCDHIHLMVENYLCQRK